MKKLGLMALALVVTLGLLGMGYSMWYQTINVSGNVATGSVCLKWSAIGLHDSCPDGLDTGSWLTGNLDPNLDVEAITGNPNGWVNDSSIPIPYTTDKNVACTEVTGLLGPTITITVHNAYPLYYEDIELEFINCGTVPIIVTQPNITPGTVTLPDGTTSTWSLANYAWLPNNGGAVWVQWIDGIGAQQIEPGQSIGGSLKFVIQEAATQGATYTFSLSWTGVQWNEYGEPIPTTPG